MPRPKKGPRISWREGEGIWVIRDGTFYKRTKHGREEVGLAEKELGEYITSKWQPETTETKQRSVYLADVITMYTEAKLPDHERPNELISLGMRLNDFWGEKTVSEIVGATCEEFVEASTTRSMGRRDLEMLRAAVGRYKRRVGLDVVPTFTLPDKELPRTRWLTRKEAAKLLWVAHRAGNKHLVRFILIGIYTGTRSGAMLDLQWVPNLTGGFVDLEAGVMHREPPGSRKTNKRKPPCAIPNRLMPHLRRWAKEDEGLQYVIHWRGERIKRIYKAFVKCVDDAKMDNDVIPHCLRDTAATWMMQHGLDLSSASKALGMTVKTLEDNYWHHHPDYQQDLRDLY